MGGNLQLLVIHEAAVRAPPKCAICHPMFPITPLPMENFYTSTEGVGTRRMDLHFQMRACSNQEPRGALLTFHA